MRRKQGESPLWGIQRAHGCHLVSALEMTLKTLAGIDQKVEDATSGENNFYAVESQWMGKLTVSLVLY